MTRDDFQDYGIRHFTAEEVERTGAHLSEVKSRLLQHLEIFRREIGQPVYLVRDGLTSGTHACQLHVLGEAGDIALKDFEPHEVLKAALEAGFNGIGLYLREGKGWVSAHLDLRADRAFWVAAKKKHDRNWIYKGMIPDFKAYL